MSHPTKDHPSIRVFAPPGGHTNNIFGTSDSQQAAANKKNHTDSDIFGCKKDNTTETGPVKQQQRNAGNNIFGNEPDQAATGGKSRIYADKNKSSIFGDEEKQAPSSANNKPDRQRSSVFDTDDTTSRAEKNASIADQHKQAQMKSNIFGVNDQAPATGRNVSDKNRSNIFGVGDSEQAKRAAGGRQGVRDPNASRMGYNPINGESYTPKEGLNPKNQQETEIDDSTVKTTEEENGHKSENGNGKTAEAEKPANGHEKAANGHENGSNGSNAPKNPHTDVRVLQPPGGKSHGPLW